jgi:uncharacterized Zn-binding protein involved in type VI secretion
MAGSYNNRSVARSGTDVADSTLVNGANTVFVNNKTACFEGSRTASGSVVIAGDTTVFVENKQLARMGDDTTKTPIKSGSTTVFADDNNSAAAIIVQNDDIEDGTPSTAGEGLKFLQSKINSGQLDSGIIKRTTNAKTTALSTGPAKAIPGTVQACGQIHSMTTFPMDLKISKTFTVGNMLRTWIDGATIQYPNHQLQVNKGFSVDQIVCNLSLLCQNTLEPLLKQYPDFRITNSFREGETQGQHGNGQACDIVFGGRDRTLTYQRAQWMRDNLPYDQLLLEYRDAGNYIQNWVHVSFVGNNIYRKYNGTGSTGCRPASDASKVLTLYNDVTKNYQLALY